MESRICPGRRGDWRNPDAVAERQPRPRSSRSKPTSRIRRASCPKRCRSWSRPASSCEHSQVRAPATGQVVGLQVFTVGGVVAPGQKLMDIVPDGRELVIQAQLNPTDADDAYAGPAGAGSLRRASTTARCRCSPVRCGRCRPTASPMRRPGAPISAPRSSFREPNSIGCARCSAAVSFVRACRSRRC